MEHCKLLIIGAGAAGMSAAHSAWEHGIRDILLVDSRACPGGILPQCSHRGFGKALFGEEKTGPEYAAFLSSQLTESGVPFLPETDVLSVSPDRTALLSSRGGLRETGFEHLILATGCRERSIGELPVCGSRPAGIFTAGQIQEQLNLRQRRPSGRILILGSGDLGLIMAGQLHDAGCDVVAVVEQSGRCGGLSRNYHRFLEPTGIPLMLRTTVTEVCGQGRLTGVKLRQLDTGKTINLDCNILITAVGLVPDQALIRRLGRPEWLHLGGNCHHVHELVDSAVQEARSVGAAIA